MAEDPLEKYAEAATEIAKATGKGIDAASDLGKFTDRVFGNLVEDAVGLVSDRLRFYRLERWHLLAAKTQKRLQNAGVDEFRSVPPKIALPLIESATLEEDDNLHTIWSRLLATAMTSSEPDIERSYVSVLADLSATDALVLESMYSDWSQSTGRERFAHSTLTYGPGIDGMNQYDSISVIQLARLGLIRPSYIEFETYHPPVHHDRYGESGPFSDKVRAYGDLSSVEFTEFGIAFCEAVTN